MFHVGGRVFTPVLRPESEELIEQILLANQHSIFQDWVLLDLKMQGVFGNDCRTLNDLILVSKTCEQFLIIEVERKNDLEYVRTHIHPQLAKQSRANWQRIIPEVQRRLVKNHGFDAKKVINLEKIDPGFMLIIPESSDVIDNICTDLGVILTTISIWMDQELNYAIQIDPDSIPKTFDKKYIKLSKTEVVRVFRVVEFLFPRFIMKQIDSASTTLMYIDECVHSISLNMSNKVEIPLCDGPSSDTSGLIFSRQFTANFSIDHDNKLNILHLHFERNWLY